MDTMQYFHLIKDTIHIVVNNPISGTQMPKNDSSEYRLLYTAIATFAGAIIGTLATIWSKRKEFKNFQDNLNLQKQLFEETKSNNENQMKAEIIKLKDLRKQYELSLKKFDFEHLKEILEFADDKNEKVTMLKDFTVILSKFNPTIPAWIEDYDEYQQFVVDHTYYRLEDIEKDIKKLLDNHVTAFASLHKDFKDVSSQAANILRQKAQYTMEYEEVSDEYIIHQLFSSLYKLYEDFNKLMELMQEEFRELDKLKRDFILGKSKKDTDTK
jgi:hypothetical protein